MELFIKVTGLIMKYMDWEFKNGTMERFTKENSRTILCKGLGFRYSQMESLILAILSKTRSMAMESLLGLTGNSTVDGGSMASKMDMVRSILVVRLKKHE